jgi:hypothetical protein
MLAGQGGGFLIALMALIFAIWFVVILPARMAQRRGRSALVWVAISLIGTPLLAILLLVALGPVTEPRI